MNRILCKGCLWTGKVRYVSTTPVTCLNQKWRQERGLPLNPNAWGVLTDGADYSYLDGRTTPYGIGQKERIVRQQDIASKILQLTAEVDFAVQRHNNLKLEEENKRNHLIASRLKAKGPALLEKK